MFNWFKRKKKEKEAADKPARQTGEETFTWLDVGPGNPFNKRILDCRSLTWNLLATTSDRAVAESYNRLRSSMGREYIGAEIEGKQIVNTTLTYPHNGAALNGVVYKAGSMDEKWDIYIYQDCFYFTRSWTGELVYKAFVRVLSEHIELCRVEYAPQEHLLSDPTLAVNNVHFLLMTHALGRVYPHKVPAGLQQDREIALFSFSQFGNKACYATFDDILDTTITPTPPKE